MNKKLVWGILGTILVIAVFLRFWQLAQIPPSPDWDEAALGYDAYSIIHTGRDEFGNFLPPVLRSFDDYKPALYAYLAIPSVLVFDVTTYAVRFPSAVFGVLTVLMTYFFVKELTKRDDISLLSAFLMAISPWSIQFSRVGFESNVGVGLNLLAAFFFIKGIKKPWMLSLSTAFAALAIYVYQSEKVFTPLLMLVLVLVYLKDLVQVKKKYLVGAIIVGMIVVLPMLSYIITNKNALLRVQGTLSFSDQTQFLKDNVGRLQLDQKNHDIVGYALDNRRLVYGKAILYGYLSHYNLNWLFIEGDISRHHAPNMGLMYLVALPFFFMGLFALAFGRLPFEMSKKSRWTLLAWFLIVPIPASVTSGVPHAVRTLNFLPIVEIVVAMGIVTFLSWVVSHALWKKEKLFRNLAIALLIAVYVGNFAYYFDQYFVQYNYYDSQDWQYGYQQAVAKVEQIGGKYHKIVVSGKAPLDKSYMFFLFYLKYPPAEYQKVGKYSSGGFAETHAYGKYQFHNINWGIESQESNVLFVGNPDEFPANIKPIEIIKAINGVPVIYIVRT